MIGAVEGLGDVAELFFGHTYSVIGDAEGDILFRFCAGESDNSLLFTGFDGIFGEIGEKHFKKKLISAKGGIFSHDANFTAA